MKLKETNDNADILLFLTMSFCLVNYTKILFAILLAILSVIGLTVNSTEYTAGNETP